MKKHGFNMKNKAGKRIRAGRALAGILSVFLFAEAVLLPWGKTVSIWAGGIPEEEEVSVSEVSADVFGENESESLAAA
ncbi:MAG: hypothetical protein IJ427_02605, partial [Lachnospiraceae bacterium]|nr:hypothetical protein [Lachnospiraceae bacterium]